MQMKSIFGRPFKYGGKLVQPQAEFSVKSDRDAKVLLVAKRAAKVVAPAPKPPARAAAAAEGATKRGTYKRRDIAPERAAVMRPEPPPVAPEAPAADPADGVAPPTATEESAPEPSSKAAPTGDE